jgi:hypothetical protein
MVIKEAPDARTAAASGIQAEVKVSKRNGPRPYARVVPLACSSAHCGRDPVRELGELATKLGNAPHAAGAS